jgi:hypothetical protein
MLNLQRNVHNETKFLNNIYDHILIPYDNNNVVPETPPKQIMKSKRKSNIYVNFFEQNEFESNTPTFESNTPTFESNTPTFESNTPRMYQDVHDNTIHIKIPRNSDLYINYEKINNLSLTQ